MASQADAERRSGRRSEGESLPAAALGDASDIMMARPSRCSCAACRARSRSALTRTPPSVFRAPLMSTIEEIGSFLAREKAAALNHAALIQAALALRDTQPPAGGRQRPAPRRPKAAEHVATRTRARH
jgi:hypothetical protein